MEGQLPETQWHSLTSGEVLHLFADAPFVWGIAGGYAVELFLGASIREHSDIDILVYRDQQLQVHHWLADWDLFASDPPGTLRPWRADEYLPYGIHDIWGHRRHVQAWQLQIMLAEVAGEYWFMRRHPEIRGPRDELVVRYHGIPCVRIEVQLLFKARSNRTKDTTDFQACLPQLSQDAKNWLREQIERLFPSGHAWLEQL
jgi:hypothetical protein